MHQKFCAHLGERVALVDKELPASFLLETALSSFKLIFKGRRSLVPGLELARISDWGLC